jgi:hypothetical protein
MLLPKMAALVLIELTQPENNAKTETFTVTLPAKKPLWNLSKTG